MPLVVPHIPQIIVLISGSGTNLQALIDSSIRKTLDHPQPYDIALVVSNRATAYGLTRAKEAGIPTMTFALKPYRDAGKTREQYDDDLASEILRRHGEVTGKAGPPDLVVLAGWMHILSAGFIARFPAGGMINLHPALPGAFDGAHAIERAHAAFGRGEVPHTGVMIHRVIAEVDRGEVVLSRVVEIRPGEPLEALEERIHAAEHVLIVEGVRKVLHPPKESA